MPTLVILLVLLVVALWYFLTGATSTSLPGVPAVGAGNGVALIVSATLKLIFGLYFLFVALKFIGAYVGIAIW